jgi:hypothetical protein
VLAENHGIVATGPILQVAVASCCEVARCRSYQEEKQFFFEKKNQKTFASLVHAAGKNRESDTKVFCFFSSEKKAFLL